MPPTLIVRNDSGIETHDCQPHLSTRTDAGTALDGWSLQLCFAHPFDKKTMPAAAGNSRNTDETLLCFNLTSPDWPSSRIIC